jgi:hypothetical protein
MDMEEKSENKSSQPAGRAGKPENESGNGSNEHFPEDSHAPQPSTLNLSADKAGIHPATTDMETHAHHLHHAPGKKIWHYFYEFLMLFLAVFCGFLAENQREHYVEHQREKKYIQSLLHDLKADTANLQKFMTQKEIKKNRMDSLMILLTTGKYNQSGNETYFISRQLTRGQPFVSTDGTMQQLKNAGNLRLITKQNLVDSILAYDRNMKLLEKQDEDEEDSRKSFVDVAHNVLNANVFYQMVDSANNITRPTDNPQTLTENPILINAIALEVHYMASGIYYSFLESKRLKIQATNLIKLLKKEYHLE